MAAAIRSGEVSASNRIAAHLARMTEFNPVLNAVVTLDPQGALARARPGGAPAPDPGPRRRGSSCGAGSVAHPHQPRTE